MNAPTFLPPTAPSKSRLRPAIRLPEAARRTLLAAVCGALSLAPNSFGEESQIAFDDFEDGDHLDGHPTSWTITPTIEADRFQADASSGDLKFTTTRPGKNLSFYHSGPAHADTSVRAQMRLEGAADGVWLWAQFPLAFHWIVGWIRPDGTVGIEARYSSAPTGHSPEVSTDFRVAEEDVILQLDVVDHTASLFAWRPGEAMPAKPQATLELSSVKAGNAGGGMNRPAADATVIFRYLHVATEPIRDPQPDDPDQDGDQLDDAWEREHGLDPSVDDAHDDPDEDGLTNLEEQQVGTNPNEADSDRDGYMDSVESRTGTWVSSTDTGTDPLKRDTDNDLLPDGMENPDLPSVAGMHYATDPNLRDSDGDRHSDGPEALNGSDPSLAQDVPQSAFMGGGGFQVEHLWTRGSTQIATLADAETALEENWGTDGFLNMASRYLHFDETTPSPFYPDLSRPFPLWQNEPPAEGDGHDDFVVRAAGTIHLNRSGLTTFLCNSDDGFILRIDGQVIGQAGVRGRQSTVMAVELEAGPHDLDLIYWERGGKAGVTVMIYRGVGQAILPNDSDWELLEAVGSTPFLIEKLRWAAAPSPTIHLRWPSRPEDTFAIEYSEDLEAWESVSENHPSGGLETHFELATPTPAPRQLFFRAQRLP